MIFAQNSNPLSRNNLGHSRVFPALLVIMVFAWQAVAQNRNANQPPTAEVTLTVGEQFPNAFLESIFANLKAPSALLAITEADKDRPPTEGCPSIIKLEREEAGVKTQVKFEAGKINAPLAFAGAYNSTLLGCIEFRGWAATTWLLEFDRSRQAMLAHVQVDDVHLTNLPKVANGSIARLVQSAIDSRINPIELLKLDQLSTRVAIAPASGALRLRAKAVRPEILPGSLQLH